MDKETMRRLEKGRDHYENREYDKAEAYLLKVAEVESGFADVMNMLGVIYHDKGQVALAQEYFEKALRINPRYTEAALNLAVTYNEQGRYSQAKQIHAHVTNLKTGKRKEIEPFARGKLSNMHADLGRAYAELQMLDNAVKEYRAALELCPDFVDIRTRLGQIHRDAGDLEAACDEFEKVKVEKPNYLPARISLGVTYFALDERELAKKEWEAVLELDSANKTAGMYLRMVEQLIAQDEAEEAGVPLDVEAPPSSAPEPSDELNFSFNGESSKVTPPTSEKEPEKEPEEESKEEPEEKD
ncbi:MAG: tetratricopeptide repeat protein [Deltaproteobacteria bacterium]|nr:tetratricopeptide repeat protein [Deltaproteobacteria bacterium]